MDFRPQPAAAHPDERASTLVAAAGLYVHIPFCATICPYCDFTRVVDGPEARASYVRSLGAEIGLHTGWEGERFRTVYFGGGTPSQLSIEELASVLEAARAGLDIDRAARVYLEANPDDVDAARLAAWRDLGVDTLSIGVQSLDDAELRWLGRRHDAAGARRAVELALAAGFRTVSLDLIFGLPEQGVASWRRSLDAAIDLSPDHVSCYQLTIHPGTPLADRRARGRFRELADEAQAEFFSLAHEVLGGAGYEAYEVSNFAWAEEHRSLHNSGYWDHTSYLGLGVSSHSYRGAERWWNERDVARYGARVASGELPIAGRERLSPADLALETVMLRLRTRAGLDLEAFRDDFGIDLVARNGALLERLVVDGIATIDAAGLRLTLRGLAVADGIVRELEI